MEIGMLLQEEHKETRPWLQTQEELLLEPWNVLIILDACRADMFRQYYPEATPVLTMAAPTDAWLERLVELFPNAEIPYLTANPVVSKELSELDHNFQVQHVWDEISTDLGYIDVVRPKDFTQYICSYLKDAGQPTRMIVHYLAPHYPFLESEDLPLDEGEFDAHIFWGGISRGQLLEAYDRNLSLALQAVRTLLQELRGKCVITADHGEMLGENKRYGHHAVHGTLFDAGLSEVPWWEVDEGEFQPAPVTGPIREFEEGKVLKRMESLGYM